MRLADRALPSRRASGEPSAFRSRPKRLTRYCTFTSGAASCSTGVPPLETAALPRIPSITRPTSHLADATGCPARRKLTTRGGSDRRSWFCQRCSSQCVCSRAIMACVRISRHSNPSKQRAGWADYDKQNHVQAAFLPLPKYVAGLDALPVPIRQPTSARLLEEREGDHPERCLRFTSASGGRNIEISATTHSCENWGIQHAIFKDILALRTITGANKRHQTSDARKQASAA